MAVKDKMTLNDFVSESNDRLVNDFFAGREDILDSIAGVSKTIYKRHIRGEIDTAEGSTTLIQGPPGIGKTSVLKVLEKNCISNLKVKNNKQKTIPVYINEPDRLNFDYLNKRTINSFKEVCNEPGVDTANILKTLAGIMSFEAGFPGFFKAHVDTSKLTTDVSATPKNYTVMVLIDEIQDISKSSDPESFTVLRSLHKGSARKPIYPVLAGMPNSKQILGTCGVYRFRNQGYTNLYPLTPEDVRNSMEMFFDYFGIRGSKEEKQHWYARIIEWSDCWPKHLHNCMTALGRKLLDNDRALQRMDYDLARIDHQMVKKMAMGYRVKYYETGYDTFTIENKYRIVGEIMAAIGDYKSMEEIEEIIRTERENLGLDHREETKNPDGLNFNTFLRKGFIYPTGNTIVDVVDRDFYCPIPSLQSYAVAQTGSRLHHYAYIGKQSLEHRITEFGDDVNGQDAAGRTPLHIATENNWEEVASVLLRNGADPELRDSRGNRPLEVARKDSICRQALLKVSEE